MPRQTTFRHYDLDFDSHKVFSINSFKGVDFRPAQLLVDKEHATDILNIIYKDKVNQKRTGWEQLAKVEPYQYYVMENGTPISRVNTTNFNGIWRFIGEDYRTYTFAHIGKLIYLVKSIGKSFSFLDIKLQPLTQTVRIGLEEYNTCVELSDKKVMAFVNNKRLYILGGNKMYVIKTTNGKIKLTAVEDDEDTYVPTTTIGVTYADSSVPNRALLDDVNLMTQMRKNGLVSGTFVDDGVSLRTTRFWDWELDASVRAKQATDINNIVIEISQLKEVA